MRLARGWLDTAGMLVVRRHLAGMLGQVGAGADHPAARHAFFGTGAADYLGLHLALVQRIHLRLVVEVSDGGRGGGDREAVHVEREVLAERHAVADDHLVIGIGAGVDLRPLAHIVPGDEIALVDVAHHSARLAGCGLASARLNFRAAVDDRGHASSPSRRSPGLSLWHGELARGKHRA